MINYVDFDRLDKKKMLFIPPMHHISARFIAGIFRELGFRAEVLREDEKTLELGMKHTAGGECLPCPSTLGSMMAALEEYDIDPGQAVFFMPTTCGPCRFGQYSTFANLVFQKNGWGSIKVIGFNSENAYGDLKAATKKRFWHAVVLGDILHKIILKFRPYEKNKGEIDEIAGEWIDRFEKEFEKKRPALEETLRGFLEVLKGVPVSEEKRPKVAVVGEIYIRSDPVVNNNLIRDIEELGGEVLSSTVGEWVFYCSEIEKRKRRKNNQFKRNRFVLFVERKWFSSVENRYMKIAHKFLFDREEPAIEDVIAAGEKYLPWQFSTEAILTIGRAILFLTRDKVNAVVNAAPMFCMPGTICSSIFPEIERKYGVPIVSNFYDGYGNPNKSLVPYMHYLGNRKENLGAGVKITSTLE